MLPLLFIEIILKVILEHFLEYIVFHFWIHFKFVVLQFKSGSSLVSNWGFHNKDQYYAELDHIMQSLFCLPVANDLQTGLNPFCTFLSFAQCSFASVGCVKSVEGNTGTCVGLPQRWSPQGRRVEDRKSGRRDKTCWLLDDATVILKMKTATRMSYRTRWVKIQPYNLHF